MKHQVLRVFTAAVIGLTSVILIAPAAQADPYRNIRESVIGIQRVGQDADVRVRVRSQRARARNVVCVTVGFTSKSPNDFAGRSTATRLRLVPGEPQTFTTRLERGFKYGWPEKVKVTCLVHQK